MPTNPDRAATLSAALTLYRLSCDKPMARVGALRSSPSDAAEAERSLVAAVERAQAELDAFRLGRSVALALDSLLPGWFYVDASDHLPREKWRSFVSNDPAEWFAWLVENGVPEVEARKLVERECA